VYSIAFRTVAEWLSKAQGMRSGNAVSDLLQTCRLDVVVAAVFRQPQCLLLLAILAIVGTTGGQKFCGVPVTPKPQSGISIRVRSDGIAIKTPTAEFQILPTGYLRGYLRVNGRERTLDDPQGKDPEDGGSLVMVAKKAFFAPPGTSGWHGTIELRGLAPGKYRVADYENNRDLGTIVSDYPQLTTQFREHLLLAAVKE
jgi:hypothetical protein